MAIIPARAGSKGIKHKNLLPVCDHPLLSYSIAAAKLCPLIDRVIVTTDSSEIAAIAKSYGAEAPFLRPIELAQDLSTDKEFLIHALDYLERNESYLPDYLVHLRPTTPNRDPHRISEAIRLFIDDSQATSLRSAHKAEICPYKWFRIDPTGYYRSISSDIDLLATNNPRQSFPDLYVPNGYVDVLSAQTIRSSSTIHGSMIKFFPTECCHDIDTPRDLHDLEGVVMSSGQVLLRYLNGFIPALSETFRSKPSEFGQHNG